MTFICNCFQKWSDEKNKIAAICYEGWCYTDLVVHIYKTQFDWSSWMGWQGINQSVLTTHQPHKTLYFLFYYLGQIRTLRRLNYHSDPRLILVFLPILSILTLFPYFSLLRHHFPVSPESPLATLKWIIMIVEDELWCAAYETMANWMMVEESLWLILQWKFLVFGLINMDGSVEPFSVYFKTLSILLHFMYDLVPSVVDVVEWYMRNNGSTLISCHNLRCVAP